MKKETVIKNIYFLARNKGIRISDIEKGIGVCQGYLSRCIKCKGAFPLEKVLGAADVIGCPAANLFDENLLINVELDDLQSKIERLISRREELERSLHA